MARKGQALKGSQKWLQLLVKEYKPIFFREIVRELPILNINSLDQIEWLSPLREDDYIEYADSAFIDQLGVELKYNLADFWPSGGPVWDGLARTKTDNKDILLFEAKSHIGELLSILKAKNSNSLDTINKSLTKTKEFLGVKSLLEWTAPFYQYTNRLAHLYFLQELNKFDLCGF